MWSYLPLSRYIKWVWRTPPGIYPDPPRPPDDWPVPSKGDIVIAGTSEPSNYEVQVLKVVWNYLKPEIEVHIDKV